MHSYLGGLINILHDHTNKIKSKTWSARWTFLVTAFICGEINSNSVSLSAQELKWHVEMSVISFEKEIC
jgi:hypothetical protein